MFFEVRNLILSPILYVNMAIYKITNMRSTNERNPIDSNNLILERRLSP